MYRKIKRSSIYHAYAYAYKHIFRFQFEPGHSLFSDNTRRCEENASRKIKNVEKQNRFKVKHKSEKLKAELALQKSVIMKLEKKVQSLTKKLSKKN